MDSLGMPKTHGNAWWPQLCHLPCPNKEPHCKCPSCSHWNGKSHCLDAILYIKNLLLRSLRRDESATAMCLAPGTITTPGQPSEAPGDPAPPTPSPAPWALLPAGPGDSQGWGVLGGCSHRLGDSQGWGVLGGCSQRFGDNQRWGCWVADLTGLGTVRDGESWVAAPTVPLPYL